MLTYILWLQDLLCQIEHYHEFQKFYFFKEHSYLWRKRKNLALWQTTSHKGCVFYFISKQTYRVETKVWEMSKGVTKAFKRRLNYVRERKKKQEAFRERRHLHVCDLWPWAVTLTLWSRSKRLMSLDVTYCIVPWYQVRYLWV